MPVMDGLTFVREMRAIPAYAELPVIMCTTHNTFDKIQAALGLGASEYIMKPFDAEIIGGKLAGLRSPSVMVGLRPDSGHAGR